MLKSPVIRIGLVLCVLAATACQGHRRKLISRGKAGRDAEVHSEWAKEVLPDGGKLCMRLPILIGLIKNLEAELISVHTTDLDFVTVEESTVKSTNRDQKGGLIVQRRLTFPRVEGSFDISKINYFFKTPGLLPVAETLPGRDIFSSAQVAALLAVKEQTGCESITFNSTQGERKFEIVDVSRNGFKALSGDEVRSYALLRNDQLLITVVKLVNDIPRCDSALPANARVLRSYILSKSRYKERYQLSKNLAHLYRYIYDTPELEEAAKPAPAGQVAEKAKPSAGGGVAGDFRIVSGSTLEYIARLVETKGRVFTCSTPVIPKP